MSPVGVVDGDHNRLIDFDRRNYACSDLGNGTFGDLYLAELDGTKYQKKYSKKIGKSKIVIKMIRKPEGIEREDADSVCEYIAKQHKQKSEFFKGRLEKLNHPNVVRFYDFVIPDKALNQRYLYSVHMEYCEGQSLRQYVAGMTLADRDETLYWRIVGQVIPGLNYLHTLEKRILHTDICKDNILVSSGLSGVCFKIGDIDNCDKDYEECFTRPEDFKYACGRVSHMSPEMLTFCKGGSQIPVGRRTDVWSFGCMLVDIFTPSGGLEYAYMKDGQTITATLCSSKAQSFLYLQFTYVHDHKAFPDRSRLQPFALEFTEICLQFSVDNRPYTDELLTLMSDKDKLSKKAKEVRGRAEVAYRFPNLINYDINQQHVAQGTFPHLSNEAKSFLHPDSGQVWECKHQSDETDEHQTVFLTRPRIPHSVKKSDSDFDFGFVLKVMKSCAPGHTHREWRSYLIMKNLHLSALKRLEHPNILKYHTILVATLAQMSHEEAQLHIIHSYTSGGTLASYILGNPTSTMEKVTLFAVQIARGVCFLRSQSPPFIHGLIGCTNISVDICKLRIRIGGLEDSILQGQTAQQHSKDAAGYQAGVHTGYLAHSLLKSCDDLKGFGSVFIRLLHHCAGEPVSKRELCKHPGLDRLEERVLLAIIYKFAIIPEYKFRSQVERILHLCLGDSVLETQLFDPSLVSEHLLGELTKLQLLVPHN